MIIKHDTIKISVNITAICGKKEDDRMNTILNVVFLDKKTRKDFLKNSIGVRHPGYFYDNRCLFIERESIEQAESFVKEMGLYKVRVLIDLDGANGDAFNDTMSYAEEVKKAVKELKNIFKVLSVNVLPSGIFSKAVNGEERGYILNTQYLENEVGDNDERLEARDYGCMQPLYSQNMYLEMTTRDFPNIFAGIKGIENLMINASAASLDCMRRLVVMFEMAETVVQKCRIAIKEDIDMGKGAMLAYLLDSMQKRYAETFWKWESVHTFALNGRNVNVKPLIPANAFENGLWKHYKKAKELSDKYLVVGQHELSNGIVSDGNEIIITPAAFGEKCWDIDFIFKKEDQEDTQFRITSMGWSIAKILWAREPEYADRMTRTEYLTF